MSSQIKKVVSPYVLKAGSIIPCVMISGLNSEISGPTIGQVSDNVYDSVSGSHLLIPQGSRIVGKYSNAVSYGVNRIGVGWNYLSYPNGDSVELSGVPGSDSEGFNGLTGTVDNHYWQLYGASFIMGVITGAMQYSQNNTNSNSQIGAYQNPSVGQTMAGSLGQQMGQTGMLITQKGLNIAPTIIVPQGNQFIIILEADLVLQPY